MKLPGQQELRRIYGEEVKSRKRFAHLAERFAETYHWEEAAFFTSPGRTELIGNHTDHHGGRVIAASVAMDTIGAAAQNGTDLVRITSEGYEKEIVVDLKRIRESYGKLGTESLTAGMLEAAQKAGIKISGFDAYVTSEVIPAAGVSSSASFEMLIASMINFFFHENTMSCTECARLGTYAENVYWNKASGMMDQMACAVGGVVSFDFLNFEQPKYKRLNVSFQEYGWKMIIVNTGKGHADLSGEYSAIPQEMSEAAQLLGVNRLRETTLEDFLNVCGRMKNDRVVLRALHFFAENERVEQAEAQIRSGNMEALLSLMEESGTSSWKLLQNGYSIQNPQEQKVTKILALSELFLQETGRGMCRVHGGGFAGVIQCIVPEADAENYVRFISSYVGAENVYPMQIREAGAGYIG